MQESIARLDDALIDRVCQPVVDRLAAVWSVDCFGLARSWNDAAALAWILSEWNRAKFDAFATGNAALASAQGVLIIIGLAARTAPCVAYSTGTRGRARPPEREQIRSGRPCSCTA